MLRITYITFILISNIFEWSNYYINTEIIKEGFGKPKNQSKHTFNSILKHKVKSIFRDMCFVHLQFDALELLESQLGV